MSEQQGCDGLLAPNGQNTIQYISCKLAGSSRRGGGGVSVNLSAEFSAHHQLLTCSLASFYRISIYGTLMLHVLLMAPMS